MLGGADNPNGELLSYIIGADNDHVCCPPYTAECRLSRDKRMMSGVFLLSDNHTHLLPNVAYPDYPEYTDFPNQPCRMPSILKGSIYQLLMSWLR